MLSRRAPDCLQTAAGATVALQFRFAFLLRSLRWLRFFLGSGCSI